MVCISYTVRYHVPVQGIGYLCQIFKGKFLEDGEAVRQFFFFTVSNEALQTVHDPDPLFIHTKVILFALASNLVPS
ncbi:hypothetical protein, partial [Absicoccus porci]|uniref:hypothetical protein n=1 Tax=Absicoccus porci TaxID=2486576 RepID=UPI0029433C69